MVTLRIRGEHAQAGSGRVYTYQGKFDGYGPDIVLKAKILIPERGKILKVERVLHVDFETDSAVNVAHAAMRVAIDETDFATVDCD